MKLEATPLFVVELFITLMLGACISLSAYAQPNQSKAGVTDSQKPSSEQSAEVQPQFQNNPIAYGYVFTNASIGSGSGNFTVTWDATNNWYAISIQGLTGC